MDSHSLEMAANNKYRKQFYKLYRKVFTPIIKKHHLYIIRTQNDDFLMRRLGIPESLAPFISFGSDLTVFYPDIEEKRRVRDELGIHQNAFVVINTGKLTESKGGMLLAEVFKQKFQTDRQVVLITVGTATNDDYGKNVSQILNSSENMVVRIPTKRYYELAKYYQGADLAVFARECSLSFYDAQACGLPAVLEDNPVNSERVSHNNGTVFRAGDANAFRLVLQDYINMEPLKFDEQAQNARQFVEKNYNYKEISLQYTKLMVESINRYKDRYK